MTADATRRARGRSTSRDGERSFRRAVPMAGTGDGPRPDSTTFAPTGPSEDGRDTDRPTRGRDARANRTADDATTQ